MIAAAAAHAAINDENFFSHHINILDWVLGLRFIGFRGESKGVMSDCLSGL